MSLTCLFQPFSQVFLASLIIKSHAASLVIQFLRFGSTIILKGKFDVGIAVGALF